MTRNQLILLKLLQQEELKKDFEEAKRTGNWSAFNRKWGNK